MRKYRPTRYQYCESCVHKIQLKFCDKKETANGIRYFCPKCNGLCENIPFVKKGEGGYVKSYKPKFKKITCICGSKNITIENVTYKVEFINEGELTTIDTSLITKIHCNDCKTTLRTDKKLL